MSRIFCFTETSWNRPRVSQIQQGSFQFASLIVKSTCSSHNSTSIKHCLLLNALTEEGGLAGSAQRASPQYYQAPFCSSLRLISNATQSSQASSSDEGPASPASDLEPPREAPGNSSELDPSRQSSFRTIKRARNPSHRPRQSRNQKVPSHLAGNAKQNRFLGKLSQTKSLRGFKQQETAVSLWQIRNPAIILAQTYPPFLTRF